MATRVARERVLAPPVAAAAITLSLAAGATDAFAFQALGGIFTANMTGNLVLTTLFQRPGYAESLVGALVALGVFAAALAAGFGVSRAPGRLVALLCAATGLQALVLTGWLRGGPHATLALQYALVACSAAAMALQTVVGRRLTSFAGVTTTFVTGTLTSFIQDLTDGHRGHRALRIAAVLSIPAGALTGAVVYALDPLLGPFPPFAASVVALALFITTKEES